MRTLLRTALLLTVAAGTCFAAGTSGNGIDEKVMDATALASLESRAQQASSREQSYLYAELVHQMTEQAGRQISTGDFEHLGQTLANVERYTALIHTDLAGDSKKLKDAEILMRHTSLRLNEILHSASNDDRDRLNATLKHLDQVRAELMMAVFKH